MKRICATKFGFLIALFGVYLLLIFVTTDTEMAYIALPKAYFPTIIADIKKIIGIQNSEKDNNLINAPEDITNCTSKTPKLSNTSLPVTALISFPASGNTWVRHLTQQLTGKISKIGHLSCNLLIEILARFLFLITSKRFLPSA